MGETQSTDRAKLVFLFVDDPDKAANLTTLLESFGYRARAASNPGSVSGGALKFNPAAIVIDNAQDAYVEETLEALERLHGENRLTTPTVFVGDRTDLDMRLKAWRGGANAFLDRPLNPMLLVDELDRLTTPADRDPLRVLIVEDSRTQAIRMQRILEGAGMDARTLTEPQGHIARMLTDFQPELILMDLHMPDISGAELAGVIRQEEAFHSIPIVFLSGESEREKQLLAMRAGGDDFLVKPIDPEHLVESVRIRAMRFRSLRNLILRDSMTGLLNHTTTKKQMEVLLARAAEQDEHLSMAITDIDHFKNVNDTYGHAVGDTVIKAMARLLKQRLRRGDVIGRMGGEEFAAVMPGLNAEQAADLLDDIRQEFGRLVHATALGDFQSTFSCGVADLSHGRTAADMGEAADEALYIAKNGGRNRVVVP